MYQLHLTQNHINISQIETLATIQCPTETINTHDLTLQHFTIKNTAPLTYSRNIDFGT